MKNVVTQSYRLYQRSNGKFYAQNCTTGKQVSLKTKDRQAAKLLLTALNEGSRDAQVSREVGLAYLSCTDPEAKKRTWSWVFQEVLKTKSKDTDNYRRWSVAIQDKAFNSIRTMPLIDTRAEHFLKVLQEGTVSTNVFLRRIHNFAMDMSWLARPVIVKRQWPKVHHKKKRAITWAEHELILGAEKNAERRDFYELIWHTGASQGDLAVLRAEDIDWRERTIRFFRRKTGSAVSQRFGEEVAVILRRLPAKGLLFPRLAEVRSSDRATEFGQRCKLLKISGVTLHSYRYAWAQRAKKAGYPERYAQLALGHNSKAVHAHYAGTDAAMIPSIDEYEKRAVRAGIISSSVAGGLPADFANN
jgi:integrase